MRGNGWVRWLALSGLAGILVFGCTPADEVGPMTGGEVVTPPGIGFPGLDARVNALAVFRGTLVAAGSFRTAGGDSASRIAAWDGSSWSPLGTGIRDEFIPRGGNPPRVLALSVFDDRLYAGGRFEKAGVTLANNIARWDGTSWSRIPPGVNGPVNAIVPTPTGILITGKFGAAGGQVTRNIIKYDGTSTWSAFGAGVGGQNDEVFTAIEFDGQVIAGGRFESVGGRIVDNVVAWDGAAWNPLGAGVDGSVLALTEFQGDLYAGGLFGEAPGEWSGEPVGVAGAAQHASMVLDANDNPHIVYYESGSGALRYVTRSGPAQPWSDRLVDDAEDVGQFASLALGSDGTLHAAYYDATNGRLKHAWMPPAGDWATEIVGDTGIGDVGSHCSIGLTSDDHPRISYYHADSLWLELVSWTGTRWSGVIVDSMGSSTARSDVGRSSSIGLDTRGRVHIAYYDAGTRDPVYAAEPVGVGAWTIQPISPGSQTQGEFVELAIDDFDRVHVVFMTQGPSSRRLNYSRRLGDGTWSFEFADLALGSSAGAYPSLAFDADANPAVSYEDDASGLLKFACRARGGWTARAVDTGGRFTALAIGTDGIPRVAHVSPAGGALRFAEQAPTTAIGRVARWDGSAWTGLDSGVNWWTRALIVFDGQLVAGGAFERAGTTPVDRVGAWNGSRWAGFASGFDQSVWALADFNGRLIAGGAFTELAPFTANYIVDLGR